MDNAFAAVDDVPGLQAICDSLGPAQIYALLEKWQQILPNPFTDADRDAGYRYDVSILQAEFSLTQMLDAPVTGRIFFEHVIRDNLDIGRAEQVGLIFDRPIRRRGPRPTPGRFRTRVITQGVTPSLHTDYRHTGIKQYHKEGKALRTETTINDTCDFGIRKGLGNGGTRPRIDSGPPSTAPSSGCGLRRRNPSDPSHALRTLRRRAEPDSIPINSPRISGASTRPTRPGLRSVNEPCAGVAAGLAGGSGSTVAAFGTLLRRAGGNQQQ